MITNIKPTPLQVFMSGRTSPTIMLIKQAAARFNLETPDTVLEAQAEAEAWKKLIPQQEVTPEQLALEAIKNGDHPADSEDFVKNALLASLNLDTIRMNLDRDSSMHMHKAYVRSAGEWRTQVEELLSKQFEAIESLIGRPTFSLIIHIDQADPASVQFAAAEDIALMREAVRNATDLAGLWWGLAGLEGAKVQPPWALPFTTISPRDFFTMREANLANAPTLDTAIAAGDFYLIAKHGNSFKIKTLDELADWQAENKRMQQESTYQRSIYLGETSQTREEKVEVKNLLDRQSGRASTKIMLM